MYTNKEKLLEIAEILLKVAEQQKTIFYSDLANMTGIESPRSLDKPLGVLSMSCKENALPLISTVVVNKENNLPGRGYFDIFSGVKTEEYDELFLKELKKVYNCKNLNEILTIIIAMPQ